jgi:murein DD-endopeptidase MepM/ murein hydrolase activator NlpD
MYAHLKKGSVMVKAGDTVKAGQKIAEVGNSGNAPFSHLHYHLQTTPEWMNGLGLPTTFVSLKVDGKVVESAEPVRGDVVERHK